MVTLKSFLKINVFILLAVIFYISGFSQVRYKKNEHVRINTNVENGDYIINYTFRDHCDEIRIFNLKYPKVKTDSMIEKHGIPTWLLHSYEMNEENIALRNDALDKGFFRKNNLDLFVDKNAVVNYYALDFGKPIAEYIIKALRTKDEDSRYNRIEYAMKFVQDIPYAVPDKNIGNKHIGGFFTPPQVLINGYGDCDSKTVLFVSILIYLIDPSDIFFLGQTGHLLTGIKDDLIPGRVGVIFENNEIVVAETAGPGRPKFGQKKEIKEKTARISRLNFTGDIIVDPVQKADNLDVIKDLYLDYYKVFFNNSYAKSIKLLIHYKDDNGVWKKSGFYKLYLGEETNVFKTKNKTFYYYAESEDKSWTGDINFNYDGKSYNFIKYKINGNYYHRVVIDIGL